MPKYVFISGGVISGIGKGIVCASIGKILQSRGLKVTAIKIDPYINYDAGTLRPTEHGEVWVTDDGGEIDEDLGHYERFLNIDIPKKNNITTGQIYKKIIDDERAGKYLGKTVQLIPHVVDEILRRIKEASKDVDVALVEIGGTVGDIENIPFLYAAKRMELNEGPANVVHVLVTYLPVPKTLGEMKTKPTQHAIREMGEQGIIPDFLICRSEEFIDDVRKNKIFVYANIDSENIISDPDTSCVYEIPLIFEKQNFGDKLLKRLCLQQVKKDMSNWERLVDNLKNSKKTVNIAMVGKYVTTGTFSLPDSYVSINESVRHACASLGVNAKITWLDSSSFETKPETIKELSNFDGVIVPGGFGSSGVEGKIMAIKQCRENNIPYLGLCLGLQLAVVEFARDACKLCGAHSTEIDQDSKHPVIDILPEQKKVLVESRYGASMRLGAHPAVLEKGSLVEKLYGKSEISERHRHRYEVNPKYIEAMEKSGLKFSGKSPDGRLMEFLELPGHPFFVATQAHPEFLSRFERPAPLFVGFVQACMERKN
jgi:CTP synthase